MGSSIVSEDDFCEILNEKNINKYRNIQLLIYSSYLVCVSMC